MPLVSTIAQPAIRAAPLLVAHVVCAAFLAIAVLSLRPPFHGPGQARADQRPAGMTVLRCPSILTTRPLNDRIGGRTPLQIIEALGLATPSTSAAMTSRQSAFKAMQMGDATCPSASCSTSSHPTIALCPPRTGHIGNWGNIADGRAGAMDFNKAICAPGYGYPLIYGFKQTEADDAAARATGAICRARSIDGDVRTPLPLHAWDGTEFAPCTREHAAVHAVRAGGA